MHKEVMMLFLVLGMVVAAGALTSAGIGIKYSSESALVSENTEVCLDYYSVYNPWDDDTYATISVSEELMSILSVQDVEATLIPAKTGNEASIPIHFCFKVPRVYSRDCSVGSFLCEQTCSEDMKVYEGEVVVSSVPGPAQISGTGGSSTKVAVSAPLRIRVRCDAHPRDYTLLYVLLAAISAAVILWILFNRYRKPKEVRDREKLAKLKAEIAKEKKKSKKRK